MLDQLAMIALGYLGWSEDQLLYSDMNAIRVGYKGKIDMLKMVFGSGEEDGTGDQLTPDVFDGLFGRKGVSDG